MGTFFKFHDAYIFSNFKIFLKFWPISTKLKVKSFCHFDLNLFLKLCYLIRFILTFFFRLTLKCKNYFLYDLDILADDGQTMTKTYDVFS
jgi:hypothetical protein